MSAIVRRCPSHKGNDIVLRYDMDMLLFIYGILAASIYNTHAQIMYAVDMHVG